MFEVVIPHFKLLRFARIEEIWLTNERWVKEADPTTDGHFHAWPGKPLTLPTTRVAEEDL